MARRWTGHMNNQQYLGNSSSKKEVHNLDNEDTAANGCQINEIISAGNDRPFITLAVAHSQEYDNCAKCLAGSTR